MDPFKNVGFLLKDLSRRYVARFETRTHSISMTLMQCKVLVHLQRSEGASQKKLSELTDIEPMTMVRLLNSMELDKLVERRSDPLDRRARRLYLTAKARPLLKKIWRLAAQVRAEMFADIPKDEREIFMRVLGKAHENLSPAPESEKTS